VRVRLNGELTEVEEQASVRDVVRSLLSSERGVAVSVDREVVPRSKWASERLHEGALVEVLTASAGG
jgi:sulfur carrier protein